MEGRGGGGREEQNSMTRNSGEGREGVMALFCRASIVYLASVCLCLCVQLFSLQINLQFTTFRRTCVIKMKSSQTNTVNNITVFLATTKNYIITD